MQTENFNADDFSEFLEWKAFKNMKTKTSVVSQPKPNLVENCNPEIKSDRSVNQMLTVVNETPTEEQKTVVDQAIVKGRGRPKGSIPIPKNITLEELKAVGALSLNKKQLKELRTKRKPRQLTDEQRAKNLEHLKAGRERMIANRNARKTEGKKAQDIYEETKKKLLSEAKIEEKISLEVQAKPRVEKAKMKAASKKIEEELSSDESDVDETITRKVAKKVDKKVSVIESIDNQLKRLETSGKGSVPIVPKRGLGLFSRV
ncbi:MAG: hypothetical protein ACOYNN_13465 [Terrimicrobiaceae bacterium]